MFNVKSEPSIAEITERISSLTACIAHEEDVLARLDMIQARISLRCELKRVTRRALRAQAV